MQNFAKVLNCFFIVVFLIGCQPEPDPLESQVIQDFGCDAPSESLYILPYTVGESYQLIQGNCGSFDHTGHFRYGFDFEMPIGTVVIAAMTGFVNTVVEGFTDDEHNFGQENRIFIEHEDGTFGRYLHFTNNGVTVEPGELVLRGQPIGFSGNSGYSSTPHLHFDVVRCITSCNDVETVPVGFINADEQVPTKHIDYEALPY
ncbi:MAG: M23 family metallopeptidase [Saprospiraceae bacterium]|nr:M23 family metallopeptidase [Saprospiraceae bacterium]